MGFYCLGPRGCALPVHLELRLYYLAMTSKLPACDSHFIQITKASYKVLQRLLQLVLRRKKRLAQLTMVSCLG
jgi:hypothetical protein